MVFGHEFCGEVLEHGPGCKRTHRAGTRVCALPIRRSKGHIDLIGLSADAPGAYAERVVVEESMIVPVPNGLGVDAAALTEPMAVAWHAVARGEVKPNGVAVVIGCGPVGLAVIAILKARGVETIVACDLSAGRRALAQRLGADDVVDPRKDSPYAGGEKHGHIADVSGLFELMLDSREKLGRLPVSWWHAWRVAERLGAKPKAPVIFECVGAKGVLQGILDGAPSFSRVVVAGVCLSPDTIEPSVAIHKEIDLRFVLAYSPLEFRDTLHALAEGTIRCDALITGHVGLEGVDAAFSVLADPEKHAKILIDPKASAALRG